MDFNQVVILWVPLKCSWMLKFRKIQTFSLYGGYKSQTLSWTSISPGCLVDIATFLVEKIRLQNCYTITYSQMEQVKILREITLMGYRFSRIQLYAWAEQHANFRFEQHPIPLLIIAVWFGEVFLNFERQSQKIYLFLKINVLN